MTVVAEGVETIEQLRCVEHEGCAQAQGFLFSPPRPSAEVPTLIRKIAEIGGTIIEQVPLAHDGLDDRHAERLNA